MHTIYEPGRAGRFPKRHGLGQPVGRLPLFQEGKQLHMAWLLPEELRAIWRNCRPSRKGYVPVQPWMRKPYMNEFMFDGSFHVCILGIRGHLVACTGMDPEPKNFTNFGDVQYTTFFLETREARERLRPKYSSIHPTAWDRIGGADGSESL
jgi:hypothetical protein